MSKLIPSSNVYNYQTIRVELIIREAFEIIGLSGNSIVAEQLEGALRSLNFLLTDFVNKNINAWNITRLYLPLLPGVSQYNLPSNLIKVIEIILRSSDRNVFGEATASESNSKPYLAFDEDVNTACIQNTKNGFIIFQFYEPFNITFLGILSNITCNYTLTLQGSNTGNDNDWTSLLINTVPSLYTVGQIKWVDISNANYYQYYKIIEKGDSILNIAEIYLNNNCSDTILSEITNYQYLRIPDKNNIGKPSSFSIDYQIIPVLNIWQVPDEQYNCAIVDYQSMIQSVESYTESINIPNSFYQAVIYGLAKSLAMKYSPDKLQYIAPEYENSLNTALIKNTNTLPLNFKLTPY